MKTRRDNCALAIVVGLIVAFSSGCIATVQAQPAPAPPITLKLDHALICTSELSPMEQALAEIGLRPDYGGRHNKPTQMAQLGFEDGTYIGIEAPLRLPAPKELFFSRRMNEVCK